MKMTYIGMNNGGIKERDRLIAALKDLQDRIEDAYDLRDFDLANNLLDDLHAVLASVHMVMRCDAVRAHPSRPVYPRLPSGAYLIEQGDDYAVFGGVIL